MVTPRLQTMAESSKFKKKVHFGETRSDRTKKLFRHYTVGSYDSFDASSDCIIEEKTVVLQKKDNEGFGFVLRGAKADTPIEEFNPTPAFPALQYLESVDEDGVAWQAGLRTGDFLTEVNNENVVKVGHRQVVNMIRHGGNHLVLKVVTVTRNLDPDDTARKKAPPPPKRAPTTALSLRSKSMTSELEELAVDIASVRRRKDVQVSDVECLKRRIVIRVALNKSEESGPISKPLRPLDNTPVNSRVATVKQRPTSRCFPAASDTNSMYDRQGIAVIPPTTPGSHQGPFLGIPRGTMRRQKSIDSRIPLSGITEEERQFLAPPMLKFTRSLSMPDASEDIPPPPATLPPSPPPPSPSSFNSPKSPAPRGYGTIKPAFTQNSGTKSPSPAVRSDNVGTIARDKSMYFRHEANRFSLDSEELYNSNMSTQQNFINKRSKMPENPYSEVGRLGNKGVYVPAKPVRRKGMLVKQSNVEDSPEKTCSIPIPTIIIKEPSTSSSGKSSQGSSMETDLQISEQVGQLRPDESLNVSGPFAAAIAGAVRDREKRLEARRNSPAFLSTDLGDECVGPKPSPRLQHSKSIDDGMFCSEEKAKHFMAPSSLIINRGSSNAFTNNDSSHQGDVSNARMSKIKGPENNAAPAKSTNASGNYMHPVTGKLLDPNSPLALALAARDRALKEQNQPSPSPTDPEKADLNKPLFIDTKLRSGMETINANRPNMRGMLKRQETESKHEPDSSKEEKRQGEKKNMLINIMDTSQQKTAGLLMVHTVDTTKADNVLTESEEAEKDPPPENSNSPVSEPREELENSIPKASECGTPAAPHIKAIVSVCSVEEPVILPFRIPPPPFASVDVDEDFVFTEPLPPPLEFANSFDIPEDASQIPPASLADLLIQRKNRAFPPPSFNPNIASNSIESKRLAALSNCLPTSFMQHPESFDNVTDSGIEEVDSRSGSDHHLETTSTISTVSSISTLSSEGGENLDTCTVYADGQAFLVDKPPVPPKPKVKPIINKSNALYKDAVLEENLDNFAVPLPAPPPLPLSIQPSMTKAGQQRTSKLWGDNTEVKSLVMPSPKANVISELNSILQQMNREKATKTGEGLDSPTGMKTASLSTRGTDALSTVSGNRNAAVTFTIRPGANQPISLQNRTPEFDSRVTGMRRAPSPVVVSPAEIIRDIKPGPLSAPPASMSDVFILPSQPPSGDMFGMSMGRSRSPSPSILQQPISNKPFSAKPIHMWTKQDVAEWLESLHLGEHREMFMDNEIDGTHLPNLQKEDLIDLGVTRVGHRMNIERALKQLLDR
ncbi:SH3 and multiple ankyrin repeat domains protein 2 [Xenopus laevis]|uniref:SH3 and multiple ankyrin repeat domains protein 2 n=2 Tax=Xenopus laevis TaxID=8355 RepID=SHAN2_XENLA|nr:SH3 and multiple ankyrin repeat domains protein 2 [Xenopus laevis]Q52KW0.1 RecName: Full=SH3 and multiple ankyrin repeat domains protein 2; Short=Shank2 [Xenopus laevis]AAH94169.1 Shank2 protein [Xenopus laevis]